MIDRTNASPRASGEFSSDSLRVITAVAAMAGLALGLFAVILALVNGSWAVAFFAPCWMLGLGLLALIFFVFFNFEWLAQVVSGRAALSGLAVAVLCAGSIALWVCGNLLFNHPGRFNFKLWDRKAPKTRLYWSKDCTKNRIFELSEKTHAQLDELEGTLHISVVYRAGPDEGPELDSLLERYAEASDRVNLEFLMPSDKDFFRKRKQLAEKLNMHPEELERRSVSLRYKDRFKYLTFFDFWEQRPVPRFGGQVGYDRIFKGEEALTSAIYEMIDTEKTTVYFVVDHGERSPEDRQSGNGLYGAGQLLERSNIDWKVAHLATWKEVPEDATVVAVCGPHRALVEQEVEVLRRYVDERKGRLLVCLDDFQADVDLGLDALLMHVGIDAGRDIVVEPKAEYSWGRMRGLYIGRDLGYEPRGMLEKLREGNVRPTFRGARTIRRLADNKGDFSPQELCSGSADSYGETDYDAYVQQGRTEYDKNLDTEGPVHYAMACWEGPAPMMGGRMEKSTGRVVVAGDSDWCSDALIPINRTFFMAVVNWLAGKEKRIHIEPKLVQDERYDMKPQHRKISVIVLVIVPILLGLAAGVVVWVRRR